MITQAIHSSEDFYHGDPFKTHFISYQLVTASGFSNFFEFTSEIAATRQMSLFLYDISMIEMSEIRSDPSQVSVHDAVLSSPEFLVACYATLHPALSIRRSVGRLVGPHFTFFIFLRSSASQHLPKCFSNSNTAHAHPHATKVAMYPALFHHKVTK